MYVSGKMTTYPSPKPTFCLKEEECRRMKNILKIYIKVDYHFEQTTVVYSMLHKSVVCIEFFFAICQGQSIRRQRHTVRFVQVFVLLLQVVASTKY